MNSTLKIIFNIFRLKGEPSDLPASPMAMGIALMLVCVIQLLQRSLNPVDQNMPVIALFLPAVFSILWCWFVLRLFSKNARFIQTATALLGVGCILDLLATPFIAALLPELGNKKIVPISMLPLVVISIYGIYVNARILRAAIDRPMFQSVMLIISGEMIGGLLALSLVAAPSAPM